MRITFFPIALSTCALLASFDSAATLGIFEHGAGIKSLGYGGISYVGLEETTAISANPAAAISLGSRFDIGSDILLIKSASTVTGNAAGPDGFYRSDGKHVFPIPQLGVTVPVSDHWAVGVAAFAAGFGPDYEQSPYARFAAPNQNPSGASAQNSLKIAGLSLVVANEIVPGQSLGLAVNLQHEALTVRGLYQFAALSESPNAVSDNGKHGALGIGFTLGWNGRITPWLTAALSYRSKSWTQRIQEYSGLLPDQGRLELPAIYGGGLQFMPAVDWQIATEFQRFAYSEVHGFGNAIERVFQGQALGSTDGPGFGWNSQNVYKVGVRYQPITAVTLRLGFSYATEIIPRSEALFAPLAPGTSKIHYTTGLTYALDSLSELSTYFTLAEKKTVSGQNSIPAALGGGEVGTGFRGLSFGLSYGRHFGKSH